MFKKLVAIEPVHLLPFAEERLKDFAEEVVLYADLPKNNEEIVQRIGDADVVLVSFTTRIDGEVIRQAKKLQYIGMCCSLYSEKSANVDIVAAREQNILVKGVRDYGDEGVVEFVISELVQLFHGYGERMWDGEVRELSQLKFGIIGLGALGKMIADGLKFFGAEVSYYSRTRKPEAEAEGFVYRELNALLRECEVVCTCVNKNTILLYDEQFKAFGERKILINTGGSPTFEMQAFEKFIEGDNYFICDMTSSLSNEKLLSHKNVRCVGKTSGLTKQARARLSEKVLENLQTALSELS